MIEFAIDIYAGILLGARNYFIEAQDDETGDYIRITTLAIYIPFVSFNFTWYTNLGDKLYTQ